MVGLPGDRIEYRNKHLSINGKPVPVKQVDDYLSKERMQFSHRYLETLGGVEHQILLDDDAPPFITPSRSFASTRDCNYNMSGLACTVPPGHYFMMGDNRDNSSDSRVARHGPVPAANILGHPTYIYFSMGEGESVWAFWRWGRSIRWGRMFSRIG